MNVASQRCLNQSEQTSIEEPANLPTHICFLFSSQCLWIDFKADFQCFSIHFLTLQQGRQYLTVFVIEVLVTVCRTSLQLLETQVLCDVSALLIRSHFLVPHGHKHRYWFPCRDQRLRLYLMCLPEDLAQADIDQLVWKQDFHLLLLKCDQPSFYLEHWCLNSISWNNILFANFSSSC